MIQMIVYAANRNTIKGKDIAVSTFDNLSSLDDFLINIIDLRHQDIWTNRKGDYNTVNCLNRLRNIGALIKETNSDSNIVIIMPQNIKMNYYFNSKEYLKQIFLKDMTAILCSGILSNLYLDFNRVKVTYANTWTMLKGIKVNAASYFSQEEDVITKSETSAHATTIKLGEIIVTALDLNNYDLLISFLKEIKLIKEVIEEAPEWMEGINMFDDNEQLNIVEQNNNHIRIANEKINDAMKIININKEYKSVLYTSGDELSDVIFLMLEDMLGIDLNQFEDKKKEDFLFDLNDLTFIGEIKGISSNVKSHNISQLDIHYQSYLDENPDVDTEKMRQLLIINYLRNKPIFQRDPVDNKQIKLAKRNGSIIISTYTFLKLYEKYKNDEYTRDKCIELLSDTTPGILHID